MTQPLVISYAERQLAKDNKCKWDTQNKHWTIDKDNEHYQAMIDRYAPVSLNVPFEHKDQVKALGGVWNNTTKKWIIPKHLEKQCEMWITA